MSPRATAVIVGLAIYVCLLLAYYGLHRLAFPVGSGEYPFWYSSGELLLKAITAVGPGFAAGWISRARGLSAGATVGAVGGLTEVALLGALSGIPFGAMPGRIALVAISTLLASAITNAVGGAAGVALRAQRKPSNPSMQPTVRERPAAD